tara:strand:+ start:6191 stop:7747 length:1557 start_codon:yes stop_codon:yes gene_type:complete
MVQRTAANVQSIPAPVGGWNARDSLANMDPMDAVTLVNYFPTVSNCVLRGGYSKWATGFTGQAQSLLSYSGGATNKLFAVVGTPSLSIYDVTAGGAVGAAVVSSLTNAIWEYTNVATTGGNYLYAVNGVDKPRLYDGTTWTAIDAASTPAITGVTTTTLDNITLFKNRLWFIQKNTLKAWYLPTSAVGGAAQSLDLSSIARFGGHLVDLDTWTIDAGYGVDDNLAFITSNGEVIVYRGTDPASDATWALAGVWKLGSPISKRAMLKWGGDLLILTYDGLMPMAASLQSSRLDPRVALSNKIQGAITKAATEYGGTHAAVGWQVFYNAKRTAVWINVPVADGSQQQQYVMNTITASWCQFTGWEANVWETYDDDPYFGGNGYVGKAWDSTYADNNANISANVLQAFNYLGSRGVQKYFTRARPSIFTDGNPAISMGINVDFDIQNNATPLSYSASAMGLWDSGTWDAAVWGDDLQITNNWQGVTGLGYCGAVLLTSASTGLQIEWASTDVVYQSGWAGI